MPMEINNNITILEIMDQTRIHLQTEVEWVKEA
jgi:hypothetical protein